MKHTPRVSAAIQAALSDINLLRVLVSATSPKDANDLLKEYIGLSLSGTELDEFYESLTKGKCSISAKDLVRLYDNLQPKRREMKGECEEWTP